MSKLIAEPIIKEGGDCSFTEDVQMKVKYLLRILTFRYLQGTGENPSDLFVFLGYLPSAQFCIVQWLRRENWQFPKST